MDAEASVDLYWLPLGAGGHSVRLNGRIFEFVAARVARRPTCDLYHSALVVRVPEGSFVIEQAPVRDGSGPQRGVVAEGPVASRWASRWRIFRYEVRRWHDGSIPDVDEAVESPRRLTEDPRAAAPAAATRAAGADADVGTRRSLCGRDVELELGNRLADRPQRCRDRLDSPTRRRSRSRLECRGYPRASTKTMSGSVALSFPVLGSDSDADKPAGKPQAGSGGRRMALWGAARIVPRHRHIQEV